MTPDDVRKMPEAGLPGLADRVRGRILEVVSRNGGHLAASLGTVELTIALLRTFDPSRDRVLWDVGHQAYPWKILTGRDGMFQTLRRHGGISGFPDPAESPYDAFIAGHAGSALAAAAGLAAARDRIGGGHVVAVVGEASLMNGESLEILGRCASLAERLVIVLNDNASSPGRAFFESLGLHCIGPVDGHDTGAVASALSTARDERRPVVVHVITKKGRGFPPAEADPERWHGVEPFDPALCGADLAREGRGRATWSELFGEAVVEAAGRDGRVCAVVAAMKHGTGLDRFAERHPDRFFDIGICEESAVTFAAGLAKAGMKPVVAIYSTFLQRAIDQIQHDVCLQRLPVVFAIDRAGCVGADGATHHGLFDIPLLRPLTGIRISAPTCAEDMRELLGEALSADGPFAIRYPRGEAPVCGEIRGAADGGSVSAQVRILAVGDQVLKAVEVRDILGSMGIVADVTPVRRVKPVEDGVPRAASGGGLVVSLENGAVCGGFGEGVGADLRFGWPDAVVGHGTVDELEREFGFDAASIAETIAAHLGETRKGKASDHG